MTIEHKNITEANLHELKGASTAISGQIPVANGSGSTSFTTFNYIKSRLITYQVGDFSAVDTYFIPIPIASTVKSIHVVVNGAVDVTTTLTAYINTVAVTTGVVSLTASGSAAGSIYSATPTANNVTTAGQYIKIVSGGEATVAVGGTITILLEV